MGFDHRCSPCGRNTYGRDGRCFPCPYGQSSPPGSTACRNSPSQGVQSRSQRPLACEPGFMRCPLVNVPGGFGCVDILNSLESCGGCVDPFDAELSGGRDCTTIDNMNAVRCAHGRCEVQQCAGGYKVSIHKDSCVPKPHAQLRRGRLGGF